MASMNTLVRRRDNVVKRRIAGETLLIPIRGALAEMDVLFALDPVSEFIWDRLDGTRSPVDIVEAVLQAFDANRPTAEGDVRALLADLEAAELVARVA